MNSENLNKKSKIIHRKLAQDLKVRRMKEQAENMPDLTSQTYNMISQTNALLSVLPQNAEIFRLIQWGSVVLTSAQDHALSIPRTNENTTQGWQKGRTSSSSC